MWPVPESVCEYWWANNIALDLFRSPLCHLSMENSQIHNLTYAFKRSVLVVVVLLLLLLCLHSFLYLGSVSVFAKSVCVGCLPSSQFSNIGRTTYENSHCKIPFTDFLKWFPWNVWNFTMLISLTHFNQTFHSIPFPSNPIHCFALSPLLLLHLHNFLFVWAHVILPIPVLPSFFPFIFHFVHSF